MLLSRDGSDDAVSLSFHVSTDLATSFLDYAVIFDSSGDDACNFALAALLALPEPLIRSAFQTRFPLVGDAR